MSIPKDWLVTAHPKRIILHWTAGLYLPNETDREHYHVLVTGDGLLLRGDFPISANDSTVDADGYAAHTLRCNTGSIGVALCAMQGAVESPFYPGSYPVTLVQWKRMIEVVRELCDYYDIPVTHRTVLTHAEVQGTLGIAQRNKWDITVRFDADGKLVKGTPKECGDAIRSEVRRSEVRRLVDPAVIADLPTLWPSDTTTASQARMLLWLMFSMDNSTGNYDAELQRLVINFQTVLGLKNDGIVGPRTWAAMLERTP